MENSSKKDCIWAAKRTEYEISKKFDSNLKRFAELYQGKFTPTNEADKIVPISQMKLESKRKKLSK